MTPEVLTAMLDAMERYIEVSGDLNWQAMMRDIAKPAYLAGWEACREEAAETIHAMAQDWNTDKEREKLMAAYEKVRSLPPPKRDSEVEIG